MAEHTSVVNQKALQGMVGKISLNTSLMDMDKTMNT